MRGRAMTISYSKSRLPPRRGEKSKL